MKVVDLTHSLSIKTAVHPKKRRFSKRTRIGYSKGVFIEDIQCSSGVGTHLDAPSYLVKGGEGVSEIPLAQCMAPACVIHMEEKIKKDPDYLITEEDLQEWEEANGEILAGSIVLIQTGWDQLIEKDAYIKKDKKGTPHYPGMTTRAAEFLVKKNVHAVGIDTASIDPGHKSEFVAGALLLKAGIITVSGLVRLQKLPAKGAYVLLIPMKIEKASEAPVRAIAFIED